ncbi:hydantoinase B/oxoprolinase family protein [Siccirubricoccus sp. KC 17139]|uniref:Hydantoinase B/oxoprolinase family protein n=1 Tax=Siccirubricoccus soli TaxID=2899147 RepID=A0ABT1D5T0_9PROT|nr:hydantoinase B/oxoprolinase family protein [Siccirubricoccus soli]MCO6416355.1 hydantoinase B/oxoprolinase family protein [Siccirubricoccus soli]MCP2682489.1 hydantoinase B/oxoprolinase family protein [Siccirubricoccus soli]
MTADADGGFDPITLEILWSRLISIADEAAAALLRTAFSTIVRESNDFATVLMDANGDSISENTGGIASFSCILPRTTKHFLQKFPAEAWRPGDCVITNDPWLATGHLPDITAVTPIFHRGRLVGFAGSIAHSPDVGGALWSADCREMFEEGIRIPPVRLLREGVRNEQVMEMFLANVRLPKQVTGDLEAQITANEVCAARVTEFLEDAGLPDLAGLGRALHGRADRAMRQAIAAVPDGTYRATIEADGFDEAVTRIACAVSVRGEEMLIDFDGTSRQIDRGINCVWNYTHAYSVYPVKCALDPFTPRNEGSYRAIQVVAPEGSILNPRFPAPVSARQLTGHLLAGAIYKALEGVLPEKVIAECGGAPTMRALFSGVDRNGDRFSQILFASGGMGAAPHRDGLPTTAFPTNAGAGSIEAFESVAPLIVWKKQLRPDSGGAGRFRGGLGQEAEIEVRSPAPLRLSLLSDRRDHPAQGICGGAPGAPAEIVMSDGTRPHPKSRTMITPGTRLVMRYAGGGGYGPPEERDAAALAADLRDGYVTKAG